MASYTEFVVFPYPVATRQVWQITRVKSTRQFQRDLTDVLSRGLKLCRLPKAKKGKFVIERRRLGRLLKRIGKNTKSMYSLQSECFGLPISVVALSVLTRLSQKIKRDESAFNTLADCLLKDYSSG
ncbi:hypothetical protein P3T76_014355 [Phytophthora citrophthora]|uniref:Uncharacterized protein n=1 Tax=Phytophthora citrophthora TaxID=4793 RepID=A0AAD9G144_9STRA|nr:hypothetical protein P3T76_014355 [Phytophthora citrophthora]